jgi:hypothetical protein
MSTCQNCKATLGCSCQRRIASDGVPVCANCVAAYEQKRMSEPKVDTTTVLFTKAKTDSNA